MTPVPIEMLAEQLRPGDKIRRGLRVMVLESVAVSCIGGGGGEVVAKGVRLYDGAPTLEDITLSWGEIVSTIPAERPAQSAKQMDMTL